MMPIWYTPGIVKEFVICIFQESWLDRAYDEVRQLDAEKSSEMATNSQGEFK